MPEPADQNLTRFVAPFWPNHLGLLKKRRIFWLK